MPRLNLGSKLILAFLIVLLPMLALIVYDYNVGYRQLSQNIIDNELRTGDAIAALTDASIDDALALAWSISKAPALTTMDPQHIDPYLESLAASLPQLDDVGVFDKEGRSVGAMVYRASVDSPRISIDDRPYFAAVESTRLPVVSDVLISRGSGRPITVVAVPMFGASGAFEGVTVAAMNLDYLAQRLATVGLGKSQAIFVLDRDGTVAFHSGLDRGEWGRRNLSDYRPVQSALEGLPGREADVMSPEGDARIAAATPTDRYGWIVGVSVPRSEALQPLQADLVRKLTIFSAVLAFAGMMAVLLSRRMVLRPLEILMSHIKCFGNGQLKRRIDLRTGDEMELVAFTFNQMADQLEQWHQEREGLLKEALQSRRELETARRRREKFISVVAHDIRNPLAVIVGYAEIAGQGLRDGKRVDPRIADNILGQAMRLKRLTDDLSDVSLIEAGKFKVVKSACDLQDIARNVVEHRKIVIGTHRITLDAPFEPIVGDFDCDRLNQALNNLVDNAEKYSPRGSEVRVELSRRNGEAMISVSDEGIGISPEEAAYVCEPFKRVCGDKAIPGTGLGLYITKAIVEAHGGRFSVDSEKEKGSTFTIALPAGLKTEE